ncbi:MAG: glycoside hydrolase family 88 protein [Verrucomicrobiales bacterium]|nr:glycoside hydrolase family 88 protein [Verrucomicrobiales bacterium]
MDRARFVPVCLWLCLLALVGTSHSREWYVHVETGSNDNEGTLTSPLATAQAAINRARSDDRIILQPEGAIYRQSIKIPSGTAGLTIEGSGVTLTGADPLPEHGWEMLEPDLFRIKLQRTRYDRHLLIVNGKARRMGRLCSHPIDFPKAEDLEEGEFRWDHIDGDEGWLTYRGKTEGLEWSVRPNGFATSGDLRNIKVFDLKTKHFLNDGFNIHGNARGMQFFNIAGTENFDEGFSAHDDSTSWIRGGTFLENEHAVADVNRADTYYTDCVFGESMTAEVLFRGGRHSLTRCRINPSPASIPISIHGDESTVASLVLREVMIASDENRNSEWEIGPRATVFIDQPTLEETAKLELSKHSSAQLIEKLYRTFPVGRNTDGSPLTAWVGGGTGNPRSSNYRIIHFEMNAPEEVASKISPENDWFGLMSPLPELEFPPSPGKTDAGTETARAIWTWIGLCAPNSVFVPNNPAGKALGEALRLHAPAGMGTVHVFLSDSNESAETETSVLPGLNANLPAASEAINQRLRRNANEVFQSLSAHYGNEFDGTYLDAVALIAKQRTGSRKEISLLARSILGSPVSTNPGQLAGNLIFAYIDAPWAKKRLELAAAQAFAEDGTPLESMPGHKEMSDSIFMAAPLLAAAGKITNDPGYYNQAITHIRVIQKRCLRHDGLYRHSPQNEAAWGRGNAFPALGIAIALDFFPEDHPDHPFLLESFRNHMNALAGHQNHDGMWHQLIDRSDSYSEFSASCMIAYCIASGIESGWLESSIWRPRLSAAWETIKTLISEDGTTFVNVCPGTGKQKTLEDYYRREPLIAPDRRSGAMAMLLAQKMIALESR